MGLEEIIGNIESDTKAKVKQILDVAENEAAEIEKEAGRKADAMGAAAKEKAAMDSKQLVTREISRGEIEAAGVYQEAMNKAIDRSLDLIQSNIDSFLKSESYTKLLNELARRAAKELGNGCALYVQKADLQRIRTADQSVNVKEAKQEFAGGLIGESSGGAMSVDYTLEKVIEGLKEDIAVKLIKLIKG